MSLPPLGFVETPVLGIWLIELCKVERATDAEGRAPRHSARMEPVQEIFLALLRVSHFPGFFHHRKSVRKTSESPNDIMRKNKLKRGEISNEISFTYRAVKYGWTWIFKRGYADLQ